MLDAAIFEKLIEITIRQKNQTRTAKTAAVEMNFIPPPAPGRTLTTDFQKTKRPCVF
jgi:hypothetical protein